MVVAYGHVVRFLYYSEFSDFVITRSDHRSNYEKEFARLTIQSNSCPTCAYGATDRRVLCSRIINSVFPFTPERGPLAGAALSYTKAASRPISAEELSRGRPIRVWELLYVF